MSKQSTDIKFTGVTLLVDADDTIENLLEAWVACINKTYGTHVKPCDVTDWDISKFFPNIPKEELFAMIDDEAFWDTVSIKENADIYLAALDQVGFDIYVCTAASRNAIRFLYDKIIAKYLPFISWGQVIVTHKKQLINGDILVDDGVHNLFGGKYKKILMTAPHNKDYDAKTHGMIRVNNWREAYIQTIRCGTKILEKRKRSDLQRAVKKSIKKIT